MHKKNVLNRTFHEMLWIYAIEYNGRLLYPFIRMAAAANAKEKEYFRFGAIEGEIKSRPGFFFIHLHWKRCWIEWSVVFIEFILIPIEFSSSEWYWICLEMGTIRFQKSFIQWHCVPMCVCACIINQPAKTELEPIMTLQCNLCVWKVTIASWNNDIYWWFIPTGA